MRILLSGGTGYRRSHADLTLLLHGLQPLKYCSNKWFSLKKLLKGYEKTRKKFILDRIVATRGRAMCCNVKPFQNRGVKLLNGLCRWTCMPGERILGAHAARIQWAMLNKYRHGKK